MPFNTALSGIRAANSDLKITGNNIANASTVGFKYSRAEFGDVYATSILGSGVNTVGSGVRLQDVAQIHQQGNLNFTENELDMAISGVGFFVVNQGGDQLYTRAGTFGLDENGFITTNTNARLQGFTADANGNIGGVLGDLQIVTGNQPPRQTTFVDGNLNLDATEPVLQRNGTTFVTDGNAIGVTQVGLQTATFTELQSANFSLPINIGATPVSFDLQLSGASSGNNGIVSINLNTANGVPATISTFNDVRTLAGVINGQIFSPTAPQTPIDVIATAVEVAPGGPYRLDFTSLAAGEASSIDVIGPAANEGLIGLNAGVSTSVPGIPAVTNGYPTQAIDITDPSGQTITYTSLASATASQTAAELNALAGVSATASTNATIRAANFNNSANNLVINLNGVSLTGNTLADLETEINALTTSTLPGISATLNTTTGDLDITSAVGDDLRFSISSPDDADSIEVIGNSAAPSQILEVDTGGGLTIAGATAAIDPATSINNAVIIGGAIDITLDENYTVSNPAPPAIGLFGPFTATTFQPVTINQFDPTDQATYNHATSLTVFDSLGNPHILTQYFVRQTYDPADPTTSPNHWLMYAQIDGQDVGDPDTTLPPPQNTLPTRASFNMHFNQDGTINTAISDTILISNWDPLDANGQPNGALRPLNVLQGGTTPVPDPPSSSNFEVDLTSSTQFGSPFAVNDIDQNGFTTGRLAGIDINSEGVLFARFTNGEAQVLAQIALADFPNMQGLQPVGDTSWAENFTSGSPNIGTPGTAALGAINAGAVEDSNVDLSEQLVNLIIAQRNFQASAKTIETADQVTQTIINLR